MKVAVGGMLSVLPFSAGTALDRLAYVRGLRALGHDVVFLEEVPRGSCRDAAGRPSGFAASVQRSVFETTMRRFGLLDAACQLYDGGAETAGLPRRDLMTWLEGSDLLLNISGHVTTPLVVDGVARTAYVDQDPVYTQLWDVVWQSELGLDHHDVLFTTGANIGTPASPIPTGDRTWHHTVPPVILDDWRLGTPPARPRFTTIASVGRYADLPFDGRWLRSKEPEMRRLAPLPGMAPASFELALAEAAGHQRTVAPLRAGGWRVTDAAGVGDVDGYRSFISGSSAEIGIAKGAYVEGRAGWIGDRSCQYLAAGRPVLLQSTGLGPWVPIGEGLLEFSSLEEAADRATEIARDHARHSRRARELAADCFSAGRVLRALLDTAMSPAAARTSR